MSSIEYKVAVETLTDGRKRTFWRVNGKLHREDGPAIIFSDRNKAWYRNGKLHREDGPADVYPDGREHWYIDGKLHREDGPAVIYPDGSEFWFKDGLPHREDGPAFHYSKGNEPTCFRGGTRWAENKEWYLDGKKYTEADFNAEIARRRNPIQELTVAEISKRLGYEIKIVKE